MANPKSDGKASVRGKMATGGGKWPRAAVLILSEARSSFQGRGIGALATASRHSACGTPQPPPEAPPSGNLGRAYLGATSPAKPPLDPKHQVTCDPKPQPVCVTGGFVNEMGSAASIRMGKGWEGWDTYEHVSK